MNDRKGFPVGTPVVVIVSVIDPYPLHVDNHGTVSRRLGAAHWVRTHAGEFGPFLDLELLPDQGDRP